MEICQTSPCYRNTSTTLYKVGWHDISLVHVIELNVTLAVLSKADGFPYYRQFSVKQTVNGQSVDSLNSKWTVSLQFRSKQTIFRKTDSFQYKVGWHDVRLVHVIELNVIQTVFSKTDSFPYY
jgi:hypothetical protein